MRGYVTHWVYWSRLSGCRSYKLGVCQKTISMSSWGGWVRLLKTSYIPCWWFQLIRWKGSFKVQKIIPMTQLLARIVPPMEKYMDESCLVTFNGWYQEPLLFLQEHEFSANYQGWGKKKVKLILTMPWIAPIFFNSLTCFFTGEVSYNNEQVASCNNNHSFSLWFFFFFFFILHKNYRIYSCTVRHLKTKIFILKTRGRSLHEICF